MYFACSSFSLFSEFFLVSCIQFLIFRPGLHCALNRERVFTLFILTKSKLVRREGSTVRQACTEFLFKPV